MSSTDSLAFGDFVLQRSQQRLLRADGIPVDLTPRVYATLLILVDHAGKLVEKDQLIEQVWPGLVVGENSLSQAIARLRRVLGDEAQVSRYIQTVPRKGFRFIAPVTPLAPEIASPPAHIPGGTDATDVEARQDATPMSAHTLPIGSDLSRRRWMTAGLATAALGGSAVLVWQRKSAVADRSSARATVAVLPFAALGPVGGLELVDVGLADGVIARLSVLPGLVVLAPASVMRFAGKDRDPLGAGRALQADWVIDGSVQRSAGNLRVVARLLRTSDGTVAWSRTFDRDANALFELQDLVAEDLLRALERQLPTADLGGLSEAGGTRNFEAYQLFLTAAWRAQGGRGADIERAVSLLDKALAIDPNFARAWAMLAWVQRRRLWISDTPPAAVFAAADAAVHRAIALVPSLSLALAGVGFSRFWFGFDWTGGEQAFRSALASNPSESNARWGLAFLLLTQGRTEEGFMQLRMARELDPMSPVMNTLEAAFLTAVGRTEPAHRALATALDIAPNLWLAHAALGRLLVAKGKPEDGLTAFRRAVELAPDSVRPRAHLGVQLAAMGRAAEARGELLQMQQRAARTFVPPTSLAMVHAALGKKEAALDELDRAYTVRDTRLVELKGDPSWAALRAEPRFVALAAKLGLDGPGSALSSI